MMENILKKVTDFIERRKKIQNMEAEIERLRKHNKWLCQEIERLRSVAYFIDDHGIAHHKFRIFYNPLFEDE